MAQQLQYPSWLPIPDSTWYDYTDFSSPDPSTPDSARRPTSPLSAVKQEADDAAPCFIIESLSGPRAHSTRRSQALAPPTEVPLRATQASSDMRRMMTVFRLNPFAIHDGEARGTLPAAHEPAHPLDAEPLIFEFQLEILDALSLDDPDDENEPSVDALLKEDDVLGGLRSFSPDFELHQDDPAEEWRAAAYQQQQTQVHVVAPQLRVAAPTSSVTQHHRPPSRHPRSTSHPYLKSDYASSSSSHHHHQLRQQPQSHAHNPWSTQALRAPPSTVRSSPAVDSSSRSSSSSLSAYADSMPTDHSLVHVRRWSLPDIDDATHQHQQQIQHHNSLEPHASPDPDPYPYQPATHSTHAHAHTAHSAYSQPYQHAPSHHQPHPHYHHPHVHQQLHPHANLHAGHMAPMLSPLPFAV